MCSNLLSEDIKDLRISYFIQGNMFNFSLSSVFTALKFGDSRNSSDIKSHDILTNDMSEPPKNLSSKTETQPSGEKKPAPCCCCKETKQARDAW